ncbi:MAG: hypothetical protein ABS61_13775 [Microbacterium sp. SCN 70-18]|nr:NYN domain-containing protein [Microbacterium chocolatum]ODT09282.1 MAG: hypothetical protein ABS61_13775 [Microbacterium sp. SCN 70-18]
MNERKRVRRIAQANEGQRRLFVIDIENVVGGAQNVTVEGARWARRMLERELGMQNDQHAVVAVGYSAGLLPAAHAFPGKSLAVRYGASGADTALIDAIDASHAARRYDQIVIVSGDGIFTDFAAEITNYGAKVIVAGHPGGVSARLRFAAHETIYFSTTYDLALEAA